MKQVQKFLAVGLAMLMVCCLASCGGNEDGDATTSAPAVMSETTSEVSSEADTSDVSETTTSAAESDDGQDTTTGSSAKSANSSSGSSSSKSTGGSSKSSGGSSSKSQSSGSQKPNSKPADQPAQTQPESVWTQAEVDALVAEMKAYAQNKGFTIDSSLGKQGTSYSNPIHAGKDKAKTKADLKEIVDFSYQQVVNSLGYFDERATINVFSEKIIDEFDGSSQWYIYVVW